MAVLFLLFRIMGIWMEKKAVDEKKRGTGEKGKTREGSIKPTAMHKKQRNRRRDLAPLMHKVYLQVPKPVHIHIDLKLRDLVQSPFRHPPIPACPRVRQSLHLRSWAANVPFPGLCLIPVLWEGRFVRELGM